MSKGKKIYCIASFAFACAVLILTITLCMMHPGRVYASSMDPDSITKITQKDTQGADHNTMPMDCQLHITMIPDRFPHRSRCFWC